ncbi:MAG: 3-oxoacyl-ACP synthase [Firmicutes bacterium HGW-Firmicutes-1]|jgi:3-oxoacyl-[acyl-carrier-protein] synthase-3|nr:MAG: 3-oxoacyl-ACP synthase [Firmicutes bacterium HGW-Firmicutes-1]
MKYGKIIGTGKYLPDKILTNTELEQMVETNHEWIFSRTGIKERRIANDQTSYELAILAAEDALESSKLNPENIELIIVATMTAEYATPAIACLVQKAIGAKNALAFDLNAACSGFIFALHTANQFMISGTYKNALIIGSEKLSNIVNWEDRNTCVLFGDGAGAVVLEASEQPGIIETICQSVGDDYTSLTAGINRIKTPFPNTDVENNFIQMDGREVFEFACTKVPQCIEDVLVKANIEKSEVDYFILHQANIRIINRVAKKLDQNIEKFYTNIDSYGNTSSASIGIALDEMYRSGNLKDKKVVLSGFGAGLTYGASIIQF